MKESKKVEKVEEKCDECVDSADGNFLFTTATCPNCKMAVTLLDKAGVSYQKLLADENRELVEEFDIKQAPTLVSVKNGLATKLTGVSDIKKFLKA